MSISALPAVFPLRRKYKNGLEFSARELPGYFLDYIPGGCRTDNLVITFESGGAPERPRPNAIRDVWGGKWLLDRGYSVIGVKPKTADWYRGRDLHAFLKSGEFQNFLQGFSSVALYGGSMGGFAALVFAEAIPGATVIALDPQSTLDPRIVPWEVRFSEGRKQDWSGEFVDGATSAAFAKKVYVAYDPMFDPDRKHVERLNQGNIIHFKMPMVRHGIGMFMQDAKVLAPFVEGALHGDLTSEGCIDLARARRNTTRYYGGLGIKSHSALVKRRCLNEMLRFKRIIPSAQDDFNILVKSLKSWDIFSDEETQSWLIQFDESKLLFCLKGLSDSGSPELALKICGMFMSSRKVGAKFLSLIAECYWKIDRLQDAEAYGRLSAQSASASANDHRILARILFSAKKPKEASDVAQVAVGLDASNFTGWLELSKYLEASSDADGSIAAAENAEKINPNDPRPRTLIEKLSKRRMAALKE